MRSSTIYKTNMENNVHHGVSNAIELAGYDEDDPHFRGTPERWLRAIMEFRAADPDRVRQILSVDFEEAYRGMVHIRDIAWTSLCPHHLLPYMGVAHVAYLPKSGRVVGISKLARLVEHFTHQIIVQEASTRLIVEAIEEYLQPAGSIAMLAATHTCMSARGARANGSVTTTADLRGAFKENAHGCRDEFYSLVRASR